MQSDMMGHTSNLSILGAKAGEFPRVPGQLGLHADNKNKPSQNKQIACIGDLLYCDSKAETLRNHHYQFCVCLKGGDSNPLSHVL